MLRIESPTDPAELSRMRRLLNLIAVAAVIDFLLLLPLLWASFSDNHGLVSVLGPIHGAGFVILLFLCIRGTGERWWGWWYPALVVITLGPLGSLIGDVVVRRHLEEATAT